MHHERHKSRAKLIFFILVLCIGSLVVWRYSIAPQAIADHQMVPLKVGEQNLRVEYVHTPQSITRGLSERASVNGDGMLFALPQRHTPVFWMKQMNFALDFIWIDTTKVAAITTHVPAPPPHTPDSLLQLYSPELPVTHVLEVPAGFVDAKGIMIGQDVVLP